MVQGDQTQSVPYKSPLTPLAWLICSSLGFLSVFFLCWHFLECSTTAKVAHSMIGTMALHKKIIEFWFPSALNFSWPFWLQHLSVLVFHFWNQTFHPGPVFRVFYFCHWCQTPRQDCWEPALAFPPPLFPSPVLLRCSQAFLAVLQSLCLIPSFLPTHSTGLTLRQWTNYWSLFCPSCGWQSWVALYELARSSLSSLWLPYLGL